MYLHEAIIQVLKRNGSPMTASEIADAINVQKLYSRKDGGLIPSSQISARINNYPQYFQKINNKIYIKQSKYITMKDELEDLFDCLLITKY